MNRKGEKGCKTQIRSSILTLDKQMYAAIWDIMDTLLQAVCKSAKAASNVAPWIMCAVDPKSGSIQKPVRRASMPVCLFTFHVLDLGFSG